MGMKQSYNKSSRVLIVDDMLMNRVVLSSLLNGRGILSDQVESGEECLKSCEKRDYDLILMDHRMPDMDGVETLVLLKDLFKRKGREIPVVCHTAKESKENLSLYKAAGFSEVLLKPVEPGELFSVIMKYLSDGEDGDEPGQDDNINDTADEAVVEDTREEIEKLPLWLKIVPHIDLVGGIKNCGSADDYMDALYIFYSSIDARTDELQSYLENDDMTMYALRVHSLKSMARIAGAVKLGAKAAALEKAAREGDEEFVRRNTAEFLSDYRKFKAALSPLDEEGEKKKLIENNKTANKTQEERVTDHSRSVLYIQNGQGLVRKGFENNLITAGYEIIAVPDEPEHIIAHRNEADIVLYYPAMEESLHTGVTMNLLAEICQDDAKIFCLTGDSADIDNAMGANGARRVSRTFQRPVDIEGFLKDMEYFSELEKDFHRKKTVFVVDDDPGYLSVIEHWLSQDYHVSCFQHPNEALEGLKVVTPDLVLLDYEMPEMDGCSLMKSIRNDFPDPGIPIIFLTGKNDREHVFRILEYKPDGYLLKTSGRETILDTIRRFFAETLFKKSL